MTPIELALKTITTKIAPSAWSKVKEIADNGDYRISDVLTVMVMLADEAEVKALIDQHLAALSKLPKVVQQLARDLPSLSPAARAEILELLNQPPE